MNDKVRVFVGTDRSQLLAVKVLEHSIKRNTQVDVEVTPMLDLPVKQPKDPRNYKRTGFSFSRFCIPKLAGYTGKAIYMDADMLVLKDISSLWNIPFNGAKVVIQEEIPLEHQKTDKLGAPTQRIKQCAVMLLDCNRLTWDIESIIDDLDRGKYNYEKLMYELCILDEETEIKYGIPFPWNSLEHYDSSTCLIHYTDMGTQPWVYSGNKYGYLWLNEVKMMLQEGSLTRQELNQEIELGYFRPSLARDIKYGNWIPGFLKPAFYKSNNLLDKHRRYKPHKEAYQLKKIREEAMKAYHQ
jgi:lipopolysaccharide biosynthesis glycosyltransferase